MKIIITLGLLLTFQLSLAAAVKPIEERNLPNINNVQSGPYDLPIITWGGDIATILANGNNKVTQSGSLLKSEGLSFKLNRKDLFEQQVRDYMSGKTPYLRGTMSMINMAAAAVKGNDDLTPVVFYQLTWSNGGDALVVKSNIKRASDLCGKTIAINKDGPHLNYANKILSDAGCDIRNNTIVWSNDLTGTDQTPMADFSKSNVDAAFVIIPDALAMTSGGSVGDGSEDSTKGARILLSTKTANRVIADVYAVRKDYYQKNKNTIESLTKALFKSQQQLAVQAKQKDNQYKNSMKASALLLLDVSEAVADTEGLLMDAEFSGLQGNIAFFQDANNFRNFEQVVKESAQGVLALGLIKSQGTIEKAQFNYGLLSSGLDQTAKMNDKKFDQQQVAKIVEKRTKQNSLDDSTIFEFEVYFKANQKIFNESLYLQQFNKVLEMSATYGGAVITIEGHSDPMGYLRKKKAGETSFVLNQVKQSAKNLSMTRANQVRQAMMDFGSNKNIQLDASQFAVFGHGIANPNTGICGVDPCAPKTEQEWLSNMRVVFRIIQVEAEESAFSPL